MKENQKTINFESLLEKIPDKVLKSFTKRSIRDAKEFMGEDIPLSNEELSDMAYVIYRAYCVGFALGNVDKLKR